MSVAQVVETKTITTIKETAATNIMIRRTLPKDPVTGKISVKFGVSIEYATTFFQGNDINDRDEILKTVDQNTITLTDAQVYQLFGTSLTLDNGSKTVLGNLLADLTDNIIADFLVILTKQRIFPALIQLQEEGLKIAITPGLMTGVTYQWQTSDPLAQFTVNNEIMTITEINLPATITCIATETSSGITESSTFRLN